MKKISWTTLMHMSILVAVLIVSMSNASALLTTKTYGQSQEKITLYDWMYLDKVADVYLIENTKQCLIDCHSIIKIIPDNSY